MENGTALLTSPLDAHWLEDSPPAAPKFLPDWESGPQVFLGNLRDALLRRQKAPVAVVAAPPGSLWRNLFIPSYAPWGSFLESVLWHLSALLVLIVLSPRLGNQLVIEKPSLKNSLVYYPPDPAFPAMGARPPQARAPKRARLILPKALHVAPEVRAQANQTIVPPAIATLAKPKLPNIANSSVAPAMPLAATPNSRRRGSQLSASAVAPSPEIQQSAGGHGNGLKVIVIAPAPDLGGGLRGGGPRGGNGLQTSAVAPAPELGGNLKPSGTRSQGGLQVAAVAPAPRVGSVSGRRGVAGLSPSAVAPAPSLQAGSVGRSHGTGRGDGSGAESEPGNLMHMVVVPPAPNLAAAGGGGSGRSGYGGLSGTGDGVVPPPPSVDGSGVRAGRGRGGSIGSGVSPVAPAPSLEGGVGRTGGRGTGSYGDGAGYGIAPPAPSVDGLGEAGGYGGRGTGGGLGTGVVQPAPNVDGTGRGAGNGSGGLGSDGYAAVGPAPSIEGTGGLGHGTGSGVGDSNSVISPPPGMEVDGAAGGGRDLTATVEEVPMRIVGLAFALPSTSFSSSYEVFIAEKNIKGQKELIKLVYWFLPYQERLSDYHPDASKMYKLRVMRDHMCDESLSHMSVSPTGQALAGSHLSAEALSTADPNMTLPCYKTTADDYLKAMSRKR